MIAIIVAPPGALTSSTILDDLIPYNTTPLQLPIQSRTIAVHSRRHSLLPIIKSEYSRWPLRLLRSNCVGTRLEEFEMKTQILNHTHQHQPTLANATNIDEFDDIAYLPT